MKQNRLRTIFAVALAIISMGAWADADSRIVIAAMQNGTITASTVAEAGEQTVTLTVTPDDTYYIETSDIIVSKTSSMAQARRGAPDYAAKLKVTAVNVDDCGKGTYQFTVPDGYGAYVEATFTPCIVITPTVSITGWTYGTYDATANKPVVTGNTGKGVETFTYAKKGSDAFSATVPENADDYIIKVSIAAAGHYLAGEATADFTIAKAAGSINFAEASINKTFGEADFTNDLTIVGDGTVTYSSDKPEVAEVDAESGKVQIVGSGTAEITALVTDGTNYAYAVKTANYAITVSPKDVKNIMVVVIDNQTYTGSELKPAVTVKDGEVILTENVDYTVAYADNVIVGTATVTITGIGNYSGTVSVSFAILADKANLEAAIEAATEYYDSIKDDYSSIADLLKEAIDVAQDILDQIDATQEDTDAAQDDLDAAVQSAINSIKIATAIDAVRTAEADNDVWYDMNGRKRQGQPTKKGLIIKNGKKMIVR